MQKLTVVRVFWSQVGFNVELGGYFSVKRNTMSIDGDTFLTYDQVVPYCKALLEVFRYASLLLPHQMPCIVLQGLTTCILTATGPSGTLHHSLDNAWYIIAVVKLQGEEIST